MKKIRRICFFGGPGSGKTTAAIRLFADLKLKNYNIELVQECAKVFACSEQKLDGFSQFCLFGKQLELEKTWLNCVDLIVTDSPLLLQIPYTVKYNCPGWQGLMEAAIAFETLYPSLNIFLERNIKYHKKGRFETQKEARLMDTNILRLLDTLKINYIKLKTTQYKDVLDFVVKELKEKRK